MHVRHESTWMLWLTCLFLLSVMTKTEAAVVITAREVADTVVFSTEPGGSLDLTGLTKIAEGVSAGNKIINPSFARLSVGGDVPTGASIDAYELILTTPDNYGTGDQWSTFVGSGDFIGVSGTTLQIQAGYVSGDPLSATATYSGTFESRGIDQGTFTWSWASDSITLRVIPIPAAAWLFGSALGLIAVLRRRAA